jgi:DNA-binding CsgD family transcriptional regulator
MTQGRRRRVASFRLGRDRFAVLSVPQQIDALGAKLTRAERDVMLMIRAGHSNAQIAAARGSSPRTVANQVRSLYAKLGVSSRAELAAVISGRR